MNNNREILKHCPHFYSIINFEYLKDDLISEKLILIYKKYIFSADITKQDNVKKIEELDKVLYQYTNDYTFRNTVKTDIRNISVKKQENFLDTVVNAIIKFFENYEMLKYKKIQVTRWL